MLNRVSSRKGFTLIELMIVIAIIAILAAILVPNFVRARAQGQLTACKSNLKNVGTALEMYAVDHNGRYPTQLTLLTTARGGVGAGAGAYMATLPTCASTATYSHYVSSYTWGTDPDWYALCCGGGAHHTACDLTAGYPMMNAQQGVLDGVGGNTPFNKTGAGVPVW